MRSFLCLPVAAAFLAGISFAAEPSGTVGAAVPGPSLAAQPWRDASQSPEWRADRLLAAMTLEQKIALACAVDPGDFSALEPLGFPPLTRVDASGGLRGDSGVTAFPVPLALAATFDPSLASEYGRAIAQEARMKRWNVILGPTVDVARDPLTGRLTEGYGEEPLLNGLIGVSVTKAMQAEAVLVMAKHFTFYQSERERMTMNVNASLRSLHEVYAAPFDLLIEQADVGSLMTSYPKVNGIYDSENRQVLDHVKRNPKFRGFLATDFAAGNDGVAQFNAGIDSWSLVPMRRVPEAFRDGRIPRERLDDATRRTLIAVFAHGVFDAPLPATAAAVVTSAEHQDLARRVAEAGTVLLKNEGALLPLARDTRIALIGPAGTDMVTGVQGSSYVEPGQYETAIHAISRKAGDAGFVTHSQGSRGDTMLPLLTRNGGLFVPTPTLQTPSGESGWQVEYFAGAKPDGTPAAASVVPEIQLSGKPLNRLPEQWSARWSALLTPTESGLVRFTAFCSGSVTVTIDDERVIAGGRGAAHFIDGFGGPYDYLLHGTAMLAAGKPVKVQVEYSTAGSEWGQAIRLGWQPHSLIPDAVSAAKQADVAVVFVNQVSGEGMDRDNLSLPGDQDALIDAVSAANPRTIVVLNTPGPVKMPWLGRVKAVLQVWYPGAAAGTSLADLLYGDASPGGRLPVTFPQEESQGPRPYQGGGSVAYDEGVFVGYRYFDEHHQRPLFPFGFGLSYTTFAYDQLTVRGFEPGAETAAASVRVRNTGRREGATVVQVYAGRLPTDAVPTPARKLVGFAKVTLGAGESRVVTLELNRRGFSYWDEGTSKWVGPKGVLPLYLSTSAADVVAEGRIEVR